MNSQPKREGSGERAESVVPCSPESLTPDVASPLLELPTPHSGPAKANGSTGTNGPAKPIGPARPNGATKASGSAAANVALVPEPGVRSYEDLDGAEGRAVFFRPHRYGAADFAPLRGIVKIAVAGATHECPLRDLSQNGVAFDSAVDDPLIRLHQRLHAVLRFDSHEVFRGDVRVGSIRKQDGATVIGVSFNDFLLDIEELLQLRTVRSWKADGMGPRLQDKAWCLTGGDRFKALVAELRLFFEDAQQQLTSLERELPWHVLHGTDNPARTALISRLRAEFVPDVVRLSEEIDAALRELPDGHYNPAAKEWSLRHLHGFLMQSPVLHRAHHKPFGYPGDYEVMNFIYARGFEGASLFARAVGLAFAQTRAPAAVRSRKDLVKRHLSALLARRAGTGAPVRVLSIAAGPAEELEELLHDIDEMPHGLEVVLLEQDKNALAHAWRRLRSAVDSRFPGAVRLTFLHESIKRILRDGDLFRQFEAFDFIYSCGLYDYLQRRTAVVLTRRLAAATKPGGRLLVANMIDHPTRWLMEHHLDWPLVYRTREELLEIGAQAVPDAKLRILEEESGANPFLQVQLE